MIMFAAGLQNTTSDLLAILGIAIALSAYLSGIRLYAIQKIADIPDNDPQKEDKKRKIQVKLAWLTLADAPMVFSAFLLGLTVLLYPVTGMTPFRWFVPLGMGLFLFAGVAMVVQHAIAWYKTLSELIDQVALNITLVMLIVAGVLWWIFLYVEQH
ncbi:hypothetical protein Pan110_21570 [Gimesia panareensis]|nr:hypothetical protein Pan110_21570 [Gimesia panareensis]